jgi:hypothetical protein
MVEEVAALNGGLHRRMVKGKIRREFGNNASKFFFFLHQFQVMVGWAF